MKVEEAIRKEIEDASKKLGKLIEDNSRILPHDQMVSAAIRIILHELDIPIEHKDKILGTLVKRHV
jgi:hypothetical protein